MFNWMKKKTVASVDQAPKPDMSATSPELHEKLLRWLISETKDEHGLHIETFLSLLGALAGFSVPIALRCKFIESGKMAEKELFTKITLGKSDYYMGSELHHPMFCTDEGKTSVLKMTASAAYEKGCQKIFQAREMQEKTYATFGHDDFGIPHLSTSHMPHFMPIDMLKDSWDIVETFLRLIPTEHDPIYWPFIIGKIIENFILEIPEGTINPELFVPIVMESAVPMMFIDPALIRGQSKREGKKSILFDRTELSKLLQNDLFLKALKKNKL
jgi:hypothetical protein